MIAFFNCNEEVNSFPLTSFYTYHIKILTMKPYIKLLKITGAVCLSCVCLTSKANQEILTLEEIRNSLEESREKLESEKLRILKKADDAYNKWQTRDRQISQRIQSLVNEKNEADEKKSQSLRSRKITLLDEQRSLGCQLRDINFENCQLDIQKQSCAKKVEYNAEGEPISIDFIGNPFCLLKGAIYPNTERPSSYKEYNKKRLEEKSCGLNKISRLLEKKDLEKRGITNEEFKYFKNVSIREITFDSILKSGFFSSKDIERAGRLYNNNEFFFKAVERYVNRTTVLKSIPVDVSVYKLDVDFEVDEKNETMTCREQLKEFEKRKYKFTYKVAGAGKEWLKKALQNCAYIKSGKEMVILLLLLDNITPSEIRLMWHNDTTKGCSYRYDDNIIFLKDREREMWTCSGLLHEIGHYLQECFGLKQTFESYQNPFAEKLLLLKHESNGNEKTFPVPQPLCDLFAEFDEDDANKNIQKKFTKKDLFMRWQLVSRWSRGCEISNILGVYFDQKNIYVNGLSQICHRRFLQYGHVIGCDFKQKKLGAIEFDDPKDKDVFESIVAEAKKRQPESDLLLLLCKLHDVKSDKFVNTFDEISADDEMDCDEPRFLF